MTRSRLIWIAALVASVTAAAFGVGLGGGAMTSSTIEINRPPGEVFAYVAELDHLGEWQDAIVSVRKDPAGPTRLGTRAIELRKTPVGTREVVSDIVEYDPPRRIVVRGVTGSVRATVTVTVEAIDGGMRTKVTVVEEFSGSGIGKLLVPLARRSARANVPRENARLKAILEGAVTKGLSERT
jgi:uncharacterized membrane protein